MPNRQLTPEERETLALPLLDEIRSKLEKLCKGDRDLLWALRRKIAKQLQYDERGRPMDRVVLKKRKRKQQDERCALCSVTLPKRGSVLDRLEAMGGYSEENTRVLCPPCDARVQEERGYK